jgi:hypothetical protein
VIYVSNATIYFKISEACKYRFLDGLKVRLLEWRTSFVFTGYKGKEE